MKRKTKAQKEAELRAALLQRVLDIYTTAMGEIPDVEACCAYPDQLCRIMCAVRAIWVDKDHNEFLVGCWNVDEYQSPETLTDFLFRHGVRA